MLVRQHAYSSKGIIMITVTVTVRVTITLALGPA